MSNQFDFRHPKEETARDQYETREHAHALSQRVTELEKQIKELEDRLVEMGQELPKLCEVHMKIHSDPQYDCLQCLVNKAEELMQERDALAAAIVRVKNCISAAITNSPGTIIHWNDEYSRLNASGFQETLAARDAGSEKRGAITVLKRAIQIIKAQSFPHSQTIYLLEDLFSRVKSDEVKL